MKKDLLKENRVQILDFTSSLDRLSNAILVLDTYYDICIAEYEDFWRINSLIQAVITEHDYVMKERKKVLELFLD